MAVEADDPKPTFISVSAPLQQDEELQVIAICCEALKRLRHNEAQQRVVAYLSRRAGEVA